MVKKKKKNLILMVLCKNERVISLHTRFHWGLSTETCKQMRVKGHTRVTELSGHK